MNIRNCMEFSVKLLEPTIADPGLLLAMAFLDFPVKYTDFRDLSI